MQRIGDRLDVLRLGQAADDQGHGPDHDQAADEHADTVHDAPSPRHAAGHVATQQVRHQQQPANEDPAPGADLVPALRHVDGRTPVAEEGACPDEQQGERGISDEESAEDRDGRDRPDPGDAGESRAGLR